MALFSPLPKSPKFPGRFHEDFSIPRQMVSETPNSAIFTSKKSRISISTASNLLNPTPQSQRLHCYSSTSSSVESDESPNIVFIKGISLYLSLSIVLYFKRDYRKRENKSRRRERVRHTAMHLNPYAHAKRITEMRMVKNLANTTTHAHVCLMELCFTLPLDTVAFARRVKKFTQLNSTFVDTLRAQGTFVVFDV